MKDVRDFGLDVDPDDDPPRHAVIVNWPVEKPAWKLIALKLADRATLGLRGGERG